MKKVYLISSLLAGILLIGCGGSGGNSNDNSNNSVSNLTPNSASTIFSNAKLASPTKENAQKLAESFANLKDTSEGLNPENLNTIPLNSSESLIKENTILINLFKNINTKNIVLNEVVGEKEECEDGGYVTYNGNRDDNSVNIIVKYDNCKEDGLTFNGTLNLVGNGCDNDCGCSNYTYKNINISIKEDKSGKEINLQGDLIINDVVYIYNSDKCELESAHYNETLIGNLDNKKFGVKDLEFDVEFNSSYISYKYYKGNVYFDNLSKYAQIVSDDSNKPFKIDLTNLQYVDGSQKFKLNKGSVILQVENNELEYLLDKDNDGNIDETGIINN